MAPLPQNTIQHFTHPSHPLLDMYEDKEYLCGGCKTLGFGKKYRCDSCDFDLHEHCTTCPTTFSSFMHPQHQLSLVVQKPQTTRQNEHLCNICADDVEGLFYRCKLCEFDVHPLCTQLPQNVRHAIHPAHPLMLQPSSASYCLVCKSLCTSWRYRCGICCVDLHLECVLEPCDESSQRSVPPPYQPPPPPGKPPAYGANAYGIPSKSSQRSVPPPYQPPPPPPAYGGYAYGMPSESSQWSFPPPYQPPPLPGPPPTYGAYPYGVPSGFSPYNYMYGQYQGYGMPPSGFSPYNMYPYHDYGKPSDSSPYNKYQDQSHNSNLNQAEGASGATNGKQKSKKRKVFLIIGKLALGVVGTTVFGIPGLSSFI